VTAATFPCSVALSEWQQVLQFCGGIGAGFHISRLGGGMVFPNARNAWSGIRWQTHASGIRNAGDLYVHVQTSGVPSRWQMHCACVEVGFAPRLLRASFAAKA